MCHRQSSCHYEDGCNVIRCSGDGHNAYCSMWYHIHETTKRFARIHQHINMSMKHWSRIPMPSQVNISIQQHIDISTHQYSNMSVYQYTNAISNISKQQHINIPLYQLISGAQDPYATRNNISTYQLVGMSIHQHSNISRDRDMNRVYHSISICL